MDFGKRVFLTFLLFVYLIQDVIAAPDDLTERQGLCKNEIKKDLEININSNLGRERIFKRILNFYTILTVSGPTKQYIIHVSTCLIVTDLIKNPVDYCEGYILDSKTLCIRQMEGALVSNFRNMSKESLMVWIFQNKCKNNIDDFHYNHYDKTIYAGDGLFTNFLDLYFRNEIINNLSFNSECMKTISTFCYSYKSNDEAGPSNTGGEEHTNESESSYRSLEKAPVNDFDLNHTPPPSPL